MSLEEPGFHPLRCSWKSRKDKARRRAKRGKALSGWTWAPSSSHWKKPKGQFWSTESLHGDQSYSGRGEERQAWAGFCSSFSELPHPKGQNAIHPDMSPFTITTATVSVSGSSPHHPSTVPGTPMDSFSSPNFLSHTTHSKTQTWPPLPNEEPPAYRTESSPHGAGKVSTCVGTGVTRVTVDTQTNLWLATWTHMCSGAHIRSRASRIAWPTRAAGRITSKL